MGARRRISTVVVLGWLLAVCLPAGCTGDPAPDRDAADPRNSVDTTAPTTGIPSPSSPASPATPPGPTEPTGPDRTDRVSLLVSGDVLLHSGTWDTAEADAERAGERGERGERGIGGMDFAPILRDVGPVVRAADLAVCHLETPLAPRGGPYASYPLFSVPPQVVPALDATGYDACTTASNHTLDQGYAGLARTLDTLDELGMPHEGAARSATERRRPLVLRGDSEQGEGVRVAVLSYTYGTNGLPVPVDKPWSVPLIDPERIVADAAAARRAGADVVAVALHFGTEYVTAPDAYQTDVVERVTSADYVDLVWGHHAHVVQPLDRVNGTWVAYGLGNFVAQQETSRPYTYRGVSLRFTLEQRPGGRFEVDAVGWLPTMITPYDEARPRMRVLDVVAALRDPRTPEALRPSLRTTLADVRADLLSRGAGRLDPDVPVRLLRP